MDALSPLPPWDQLAYFQSPREVVVVNVGDVTRVAPADPTRVMLAFGVSIGQTVYLGLNAATFATGGGIVLSNTNTPIVITQAVWGPYVNAEWYAYPGSGVGQVTVWQVCMAKWPAAKRVADNGDARQRQSILSKALSVLRKGG